jgi:Glycosyl transferase family 90
MLEGNDVASGLKWALLSQSVVLMPVPRHTSWAMEEWLEPWIHYIPLQEDAADVEEKMAWVLEHEEEARAIAYASTLWMQDLIYHPDAAEDDIWIREEMVRRYQLHFSSVTR